MARDVAPLIEALERAGYTPSQAREAAMKFAKTDTPHTSYPYTLPFVWQNRTHYVTADRDDHGRLILKRVIAP